MVIIMMVTLLFMVGCGSSGGGGGSTGGPEPEIGPVASGRAVLGVLTGSQVGVYDYTDLETPIHTTTTSTDADLDLAGRFDIPESLIADAGLYVIAISQGSDMDVNNDGIADSSPTSNVGTLHLVITGHRLKAGPFQANILTEIVYQKIRYLLLAEYPVETIVTVMDRYICALLKEDVDGNRVVNMDDILAFNPVIDRDRSSLSWGFLSDSIWAIRNNEPLGDDMNAIRENIISMIETPEYATELVIRDDYAFVVDSNGFSGTGTSSLRVFDYSDPSTPVLAGSVNLPGNARALTLSGDYAYVADGYEGLTIVRISSPTIPYVMGNVSFAGSTRDVVVSGDTAFVANYVNGSFGDDLVMVDISDPRHPSVLSTLDLPGIVSRVALSGNTAYVTAGSHNLHIVDVTDPAAPRLVDTYDRFLYDVYFVETYGGNLFTLDVDGSNGRAILRIHSLSAPTAPSQTGFVEIPAYAVEDLFIDGRTAYLCTRSHGIVAVDISDVSRPRIAFRMDTPGGFLNDLYVSGTTAWVSESYLGVYTVDMSHPDAVQVYSNLGSSEDTYRVDAQGNYAYVGAAWGGFNIITITDPDFPSRVGATRGYVQDFAISGNHAIVADTSGGGRLEIWDISDPRTPERVSTMDTPRTSVAVSGDYILVGAGPDGLKIYDMSDPVSPSLVGGVDTPGDTRSITVYSHYALVADGEQGVQVIDISHPETPDMMATLPTTRAADHVAVSGSTAWIAEEERVVGVSLADPSSPAVIARIPVPGTAYRVAVANGWLYVAAGDAGIQVIDIRDPEDIHLDSGIATSHEARDVSVANGHVFVADYSSGMSVFRAIP